MGFAHSLFWRDYPREGQQNSRNFPINRPRARRTFAYWNLTIRSVLLLLLGILTWTLAHPYRGIFHDANLYTLQALAHLHSDTLTQDVFLRFGSQDRFTVFSPIYATVIRNLGVDHAAALLTVISQAALFIGAWCLARAVMQAEYASLGLLLIIAVPGDYGPGRIFACVEPFLTPRMGGEALILASLAAAFSGRRYWSAGLLVAAFAIHPVMAAAGAVLLLIAYLVLPHRQLGVLFVLLTGAWLLLAWFAMPVGTWGRLDAEWFRLVAQRSPYLFLASWQLDDWGRVAVALTILIIGSVTLKSRVRLLCLASAVTVIAGLFLTGLACDVLHLTLFTQIQSWRWQWIGTLVAAAVLPFTVTENWKRGLVSRATALSLISAFVFGDNEFAIVACVAALLSLTLGHRKLREQQLIFWGSCALLILALIWRSASNLEFTDVHYMEATSPLWVRRLISFTYDGCAPAALLCLVVWTMRRTRARIFASICALAEIAVIVALAPFVWSAWSQQDFPPAQVASFTSWTNLIGPHEEVFWAESPLWTWVLLNRPNYISAAQTAGMIFSRVSALELQRRAIILGDYVEPAIFLSWSNIGSHLSLTPEALKGICGFGRVRLSSDELRSRRAARGCDGPTQTISLQASSARRSRRNIRNRCIRETLERHFLPRALSTDQRAQQLVVESMTRLVPAELADQAVPQ